MSATFNTVNKWAQDIGDTLVSSLLCECLGRGTPSMIAVPCLKVDLVGQPAFIRSVAVLREYGVYILQEPERYQSPLIVPWEEVLTAMQTIIQRDRPIC
jgi:phosphopantothenoylcysteine decarboxylase